MNRQLNRCSFLLLSALLLLLAACSQDARPQAAADTPSFSFSIDPAAGSVELASADAAALAALADTCESRTLIPDKELKIVNYNFKFLPGDKLIIEADFKNVIKSTFNQLTFIRLKNLTNIVSTTEPKLTNKDLGGDEKLSPDEITAKLTFEVQHKGQAFSYKILAKALLSDESNLKGAAADCGEPDAQEADLEVKQTDAQDPINLNNEDPEFTYTVTVANVGSTAANDVKLVDTFGNASFPAVLTSDLPEECSAPLSEDQPFPGAASDITCDLGTLDTGGSKVYTFTFSPAPPDCNVSLCIDIGGSAQPVGRAGLEPQNLFEPALTNTATVTTTSPETNTENNISVEGTTLTFGEPEPEPTCTDPVSIPDVGLEAAVRDALGKPTGDITCADMESLTTLSATGFDSGFIDSIFSLEGLQYAVNLTDLNLSSNRISGVSQLVANPGIGDGSDQINLQYNCLYLSTGSQAQTDITTLENRNSDQQNIYAEPQPNDCN